MNEPTDKPVPEVLDDGRPLPPRGPSVLEMISVLWFCIGVVMCVAAIGVALAEYLSLRWLTPLLPAAMMFLGALFIAGSLLLKQCSLHERP